MNCFIRLIFSLWVVALSCYFNTQCNAQDIIFSKPLPGDRVLWVYRKPIPYVIPSTFKEQEKHLPPGVSFTYPSYRYLYSFTVASKKHTAILWSHPVDSFQELLPGPGPIVVNESESTNLVVLDATVEGSTLIVVYKQGRSVVANVIKSDITGPKHEMAWIDANILGDVETAHSMITIMAARIQGFLKQNNLEVSFSTQRGDKLFFLYQKDKWIFSAHKSKMIKEDDNHKAL